MTDAAKGSLVDETYHRLKSEILNNELSPGTQLSEPEIALRLDTGKSSVREAQTRLEADGLVELEPFNGARVLPISATDMREIYEILTALEPQAAYSLALAGLDREQLAGLECAVFDMERALDDEDLEAWGDADYRFHQELLALNGNSRLSAMVKQLADQAHRVRMLTVRQRKLPVRSTFEHRSIFDAIARGDAENARDSYARHRERSAEELLKLLAPQEAGTG